MVPGTTERALRGAGKTTVLQRILLVTDGTVTNILEAYAGEMIDVVKLKQSVEPAVGALPDLDVDDHEDVLSREVLLRGRRTGKTFVHATSRIVPGRLASSVRDGLLRTTKPIGRLLEESRTETFRELLGSHREIAGRYGKHFGLAPDAPLIARSYRVLAAGRPIMHITERFPAASFAIADEGRSP